MQTLANPPKKWPPDYLSVILSRQLMLREIRGDVKKKYGAKLLYAQDPPLFIQHFGMTVDPRVSSSLNKTAKMPFVMFKRQVEFIQFLHELVAAEESGLVEKSRDVGATWLACAFSVWLWLYKDGASVGWGSRKADLVDRIGDMDSIFEKIRTFILCLPEDFWPLSFDPSRHMSYMRIVNPETGASITGESGDDIGRGGRKLVYFKDESAHYEHPESIEAALTDNTRIQVDISSVCGFGTVFERKRVAGVDWSPGQGIVRGKTNVFVFDWRDHPEKDQAWYDQRRKKHEDEGLLHIFAQEVDRDYSASLDGVVIPAVWVKAAIDAHVKLGLDDSGGWSAGLDVADEGGDTNALAVSKGIVLKSVDEWGGQDTGVTTRRAADACSGLSRVDLQYDCVGIGAGVKAEANRLRSEGLMPHGVTFVPWNAGGEVLRKDERFIRGDKNTPTNGDLFGNLKAQAWWNARRRFEMTHRAIRSRAADATPEEKQFTYRDDQIISLSSSMPNLFKLVKELSQATVVMNSRMKMAIDKKPDGAKSPNLADAVVMCFFPVKTSMRVDPVAVEKSLKHTGGHGTRRIFNRARL